MSEMAAWDDEVIEELPDITGLKPVRRVRDLPQQRIEPSEALRRFWGYDAFRPMQAEAVGAALAKRDCMIILPTGGGKSLCFQVPAACGAGLVLVVSPLIALMDDQVAAAREAGLNAGALHQNVDADERRRVRADLDAGTLALLYVSPERLVAGDLNGVLTTRLALVAVDEAHCVSHWGHDFRPEYRQLATALDRLPRAPRMALTATATPQVQDDIALQLALRDPLRLVGAMDRPNLLYRALPRDGLIDQILTVIARHGDEGGIVYAQTRKSVEEITEKLRAAAIDARGYHAGMPADERARVQRDFVNERLRVVVATIAFGMGIDRSNVRFVVHASCPKSVEHYQQEAGRAGRDGASAECVLIYSGNDFATWRFIAGKDGGMSPERQRVFERQLAEIGRYAVSPVCRHRLLTAHFGQTYSSPSAAGCGACDVCLGEIEAMEPAAALTIAQQILSAVWRLESRFGASHVTAVLRGSSKDELTRRGHHTLSVYGLLKDHSEQAVRSWIDQLVLHDLLLSDGDDYPVLVLTEAGRAVCRLKPGSDHQVRLGKARVITSRRSKNPAAGTPSVAVTGADSALFERLRVMRKRLSEAMRMPPYVIAHDRTLLDLVAAKPTTIDELAAVRGMGERKAKRYGPALLAVLAGADPFDPALIA